MKKLLLVIFIASSYFSQSQTVVHINAGSRASWGKYQNLMINVRGRVTYHHIEVNGRVLDSSSFSITKAQLDSFLLKAEQVGFFSLKEKYDGGMTDGAGIMISLNSAGKIKSVQLKNTDVPQVNELIAWLNRVLQPNRIRLYYGQK